MATINTVRGALDAPTRRDLAVRTRLCALDRVLPALQARGETDQMFDARLIANPRRIFERQGAY